MEGGTLTHRACAHVKNYFAYLYTCTSVYLPSSSREQLIYSSCHSHYGCCLPTGGIHYWGTVWCIGHCLHQQVEQTPNTKEQRQAIAVYEEVDTQRRKIELEENVAYGPVKQIQEI